MKNTKNLQDVQGVQGVQENQVILEKSRKNVKVIGIVSLIFIVIILMITIGCLVYHNYNMSKDLEAAQTEIDSNSFVEGRTYDASEKGGKIVVSKDWLVFEDHIDLLRFINNSKGTDSTKFSQKYQCMKDVLYEFDDSGYVDSTQKNLIKLLYNNEPVKVLNCYYYVVGSLDKREIFYVTAPLQSKKVPLNK